MTDINGLDERTASWTKICNKAERWTSMKTHRHRPRNKVVSGTEGDVQRGVIRVGLSYWCGNDWRFYGARAE